MFIHKSFLEFRKYLYLKTLCFLGPVFCGELGWMWVRIEGHYCMYCPPVLELEQVSKSYCWPEDRELGL